MYLKRVEKSHIYEVKMTHRPYHAKYSACHVFSNFIHVADMYGSLKCYC